METPTVTLDVLSCDYAFIFMSQGRLLLPYFIMPS